MKARQIMPRQCLILADPPDWRSVERLPRGGGGVLVIGKLRPADKRRLRRIAMRRGYSVLIEHRRTAARVHNVGELTRALLHRPKLVLISPLYATSSHPQWKPLPRTRAATLARLAGRGAIALGGMDEKRFAKIAQLGFIGWAGISAFRT
jgi:thiamine-phosphate pyrophosphorylase